MAELDSKNVVITKRTSDVTTTGAGLSTGSHTISSYLFRVSREWQPGRKDKQRFRDDVIRRIEQLLNNTSGGSGGGGGGGTGEGENPGGGTTPDIFYDTGYFYMGAKLKPGGSNHWSKEKKHNFGQIPSRFTFFFSNSENPKFTPLDEILVVVPFYIVDNNGDWVGFVVSATDENTISISAPGHRLIRSGANAYQTGYFRILMWR